MESPPHETRANMLLIPILPRAPTATTAYCGCSTAEIII